MMGLKIWMSWLAWFFKYLTMLLIAVVIMTFLFHVPLGIGAIMIYSHWSVTFVFLLLYAISVIMFCFMISVFFSKGWCHRHCT